MQTFLYLALGVALAATMCAGFFAADTWLEVRRANRDAHRFIGQRLRGERP